MDNQDNKSFSFASQEEFVEAVNKVVHGAVTNRFDSFERKMEKHFASRGASVEEGEREETKNTPTARITKQEQEMKNLREELAKEKRINQDKTLKSSAVSVLSKLGLPASSHRAALALLNEDKLISLDEEGNAKFVQDGGFVDLEIGLKSLLKSSDEFKSFVPQKVVNGASDRKYQVNNTPKADTTSAEDLFEIMTEYRNS